ncbi:MAG TPA: magnesium and cobalt transport protein CorA [Bacteroidetes bacterium]|nr:magnesium and cobalt transport protein CorA [Bacteroidota bacterium]
MITIFEYNNINGCVQVEDNSLKSWDKNGNDIIWIDIQDESSEKIASFLKDNFNFHPLVIEHASKYTDFDKKYHLPKVEDFEEYVFIVFNSIEKIADAKFKVIPLSCFLGHNFLITIHSKNLNEHILLKLKEGYFKSAMKKGVDYFLHIILDEIVDKYYPILDGFEAKIDSVQDIIFKRSPSNRTLIEIMNLKKQLVELRRIAFYQKEVLFKVTRGDIELITESEAIYYRNVYDHLVRVTDSVESYRDLITSLMDSYLSIVNNRLSEITKVLTIIATIVLPLNLITGIYGMNLIDLPFADSHLGFYFVLTLMVTVIVIMLLWFKRKQWIDIKKEF